MMLAMNEIVGTILEKIIAGSGDCRAAGHAVLRLSRASMAFCLKI